MAPRKKTAAELIRSNARSGRIKARQREEAALLAKPWIKDFFDTIRREHRTFSERFVPGETILREIDGETFDWPEGHFLTDAKAFAEEIINDPTAENESLTECRASLDIFNNGASKNIFVDPEGAKTIITLLDAFAPDDGTFTLWRWSQFRLVDYFCWKTSTGEYAIQDRAEMGFEDQIEKILDAASAVLNVAGLPFTR